jgi:hypothetical protein
VWRLSIIVLLAACDGDHSGVRWTKVIPTSELGDLAVTADGSIVFSAELNDHGERDLLIGELTPDGEPRTSHHVRTGLVTHSTLAVDADGGMFLAGGFAGHNDGHTYPLELDLGTGPHTIAGGYDLVVAGFAAPDAPASWTNQVRGAENDFAFDLVLDPAGDVIVVGDVGPGLDFDGTEQVPGGACDDLAVAKLDGKTGAHRWTKRFGSLDSCDSGHPASVAVDAAGDVVVTGFVYGRLVFAEQAIAASQTTLYVIKLAGTDGSMLWARTFATDSQWTNPASIAFDPAGDVVIAGDLQKPIDFGGGPLAGDNQDVYVARLSGRDGSHLMSRRLVAPDEDFASAFVLDGNDIVIAGARFGAPIAPGFEFLGYAVTTLDRDGDKRGEVFVDHVSSGPFRMALAPDGSLALGGFIGELPNEDTFIAVLDR